MFGLIAFYSFLAVNVIGIVIDGRIRYGSFRAWWAGDRS